MLSLFSSHSRIAKYQHSHLHSGITRLCHQLRTSLLSLTLIVVGSCCGYAANAQDREESPASPAESAMPGSNLLPNGDFALGVAGWKAELMNGKASALLSWPTNVSPPPGAGGKVARFDIEAIDKERWHAQFYHDGLDLNNNSAYTVTFWAKASQERPLSISANLDVDDYHSLGLDNQVFIGPQWRKVSLVFTALRTRKNHNRLCFMLGDALGRVELADVHLQKGINAAPLSSNLLHNAGFEQGINSWIPMHPELPAQATLQIVDASPAGVTGKTARINVSTPGTELWHVYFGQSDLPLKEETIYTLSFWAKSNRSRSLSVHSDIAKSDYHRTGLGQVVALTPLWNKYTFVFTPTNTGGSMGRIIFSAGDSTGDIDLAGIALQRGAMTPVNAPASTPDAQNARVNASGKTLAGKSAGNASGQSTTRAHRSHPLLGTWQSFHKEEGLTGKEYQRYRFVFDANGTGSLQVATMSADPNAPPKSQQTETFRWDLIEGGPHVTIGANVYTWTLEKDNARQKLTLKNYEGKTYILFRQ